MSARILVHTRTTAYRHDSIPAGVAALRALGFDVDATEEPDALEGPSAIQPPTASSHRAAEPQSEPSGHAASATPRPDRGAVRDAWKKRG